MSEALIDPEFLALLACPCCESRPALREEGGHLVCTQCRRRYPVVDGIPHLLPESALDPEGGDAA